MSCQLFSGRLFHLLLHSLCPGAFGEIRARDCVGIPGRTGPSTVDWNGCVSILNIQAGSGTDPDMAGPLRMCTLLDPFITVQNRNAESNTKETRTKVCLRHYVRSFLSCAQQITNCCIRSLLEEKENRH